MRTKPLFLKQQYLWLQNLWHLLKPQYALTLLLVEQFLMEQFLIQQILQSCVALVQHSVFNFKRVADLDSFNSGYIYLSSLGKFSSFVFNIFVITGINCDTLIFF